MRPLAATASAVITVCLFTACARGPLLAPDDRRQVCRFAVDEKFGAAAFHANIFSSSAGGLVGAGAGALGGLQGGLLAIFTVPIGAAIGAVGGTACGVASLEHPTAEAEFEKFLHDADASALKRALEAALNSPRAECGQARMAGSATMDPDAVIEIEKLDVGMSCLLGQQEYWIAVQWRTITAKAQRALNWTTTRCTQTSFRSVDDWFGNPDQARKEIERVLAKTGQRMAAELLSQEQIPLECKLRSDETGEVHVR